MVFVKRSVPMVLIAVLAVAALLFAAVPPAQAASAKPAKAVIASAKSPSASKITVKVKKVKRAKGYQYQLAVSKTFKKLAKAKTTTARSITFKKLKAGKTYYVRVRAYAKSGGKKLFGAWSKPRKVRVKAAFATGVDSSSAPAMGDSGTSASGSEAGSDSPANVIDDVNGDAGSSSEASDSASGEGADSAADADSGATADASAADSDADTASASGAASEGAAGGSTSEDASSTPAVTPTTKQVATVTVSGFGSFRIELYPDNAPVTVENFTALANSGFYDNTTFHRMVAGFVLQGGDPTGTGLGGSADAIVGEFPLNDVENPLSLQFGRGVVAMARTATDYDSATSQFFVTLDSNESTVESLNGSYAAFGVVSEEDMAVVDAIASSCASLVDETGVIANYYLQPVIESIRVNKVTVYAG